MSEEVSNGIDQTWKLSLYISSDSMQCQRAVRLVTSLATGRFKDICSLEIVDLKKRPELARERNILVLPTLIRETPKPVRMYFGNLGTLESLEEALDLSDDLVV